MSLQKESEWSTEKTYSECFFDECAMTQKLSPEQCQYATDYFSKFISSAISTEVSNREKEIAEEVKSIKGYDKHALGGAAFTNSVCKGCDTGFVAPSTLGGLCHHCEAFSKKVLKIIKH